MSVNVLGLIFSLGDGLTVCLYISEVVSLGCPTKGEALTAQVMTPSERVPSVFALKMLYRHVLSSI